MTVRVRTAPLEGARAGDTVSLADDDAHHLARVTRVRAGDAVTVFDGRGLCAPARVDAIHARGKTLSVTVVLEEAPRAGVTADSANTVLLQAVPKGDKLEQIVRQATELGVRAVVPVVTSRSVPVARDAAAKRARLEAVAWSACAQCGRAELPVIGEIADLETTLRALDPRCVLRVVPWEQGGAPIADVIARAQRVTAQGEPAWSAVLVGPEGGLDAREVARAEQAGFVPVSLGPRIVRTETVAPAVLAILSLLRGDLRAT